MIKILEKLLEIVNNNKVKDYDILTKRILVMASTRIFPTIDLEDL